MDKLRSLKDQLEINRHEMTASLESTLSKQLENIFDLESEMLSTIENKNRIFFCGNGGSFADAQHIVGELVVRFKEDRIPFDAFCLGTNSTITTAVSNDFSFVNIFSRELEALYRSGDLLICLSTSGKSSNILDVLNKARTFNLNSWLITGNSTTSTQLAKKFIYIDSQNTPIIQEITMHLMHFICGRIEKKIKYSN